MFRFRFILYLGLFAFFFFIIACSGGEKEFVISGGTMGTSYTVKYFVDASSPLQNADNQEKLAKAIDDYLIAFNKVFSTYDKHSEISKINQSQDKAKGFQISGTFYRSLKRAIEISHMTGFTFEPTVAPLVNLWGFGWKKDKEERISSDAEIQKALEEIGIDKVELGEVDEIKDDEMYPVRMPDKLELDFSAIVKGRGVDGVANILEKNGVENYLVEIGGELSAKGMKGDQPWQILIAAPVADNVENKVVKIKDKAIATSGDYLNYFEKNGVRYSHIIDPTTGRPITHGLASVSVIRDSCEEADALATALMVMGEERGTKFAEEHDLAVFFIYRDKEVEKLKDTDSFPFKQYATKAFNDFLVEKREN